MRQGWRKEQYIPKLKTQRIPKRYLFFDTETEQVYKNENLAYQKLKLGVAIFVELTEELEIKRRIVYKFTSSDEFIDIVLDLERSRKTLIIVAHNIKFDIEVLNLPFKFTQLGYDHEYPINQGMMFIWRVSLSKGKLQFIDTANYVPRALSTIGQDLGFPKLDVNFDEVSTEELFIYCQRDVEICEKFILTFARYLDKHSLGSFKLTLASQAFTTYRTKFMKTQPYTTLNADIIDIERKAYHGGRTECFYIGKLTDQQLFYLDINSAYPYAMTLDRLPYEPITKRRNPTIEHVINMRKVSYVIAHVRINTTQRAFPFVYTDEMYKKFLSSGNERNTHRMMLRDRLIFPIGSFDTYLHDSELEYALSIDAIEKIHYAVYYRYEPILKDYVDFFYKEKQEATISGNKSDRLMAKLFMNTLYGKFGQKQHHTEVYDHPDKMSASKSMVYNLKKKREYIEYIWYGKRYLTAKFGESTYSVPSIAGAVTAYARMLLWDYMLMAGLENVYYVDTDSIITNKTGYDNLIPVIDSLKLGALDIELEADSLHIFNNKDYHFGDVVKMKGVPKSAQQIDDNTFVYWQFEGFKTWLKRGGLNEPQYFKTQKTRRGEYRKGIKRLDGFVDPLILAGEDILITD